MFQRWILASAAVLAIVSSSCSSCSGPPVVVKDQCVDVPGARGDMRDVCTEATDCGDHYACKDVKDKQGVKCCVYADRLCTGDADCCAGQFCQTMRNPPRCADRFNECTTDAECGEVGDRFCTDYSDTASGMGKRCRHRACGALGECPEGQSCFQKECIAELPCGGTCPAGEACVPSAGLSGRCQAYANPTGRPAAACPMTCNPGFIATFVDNTNIWDSCKLNDVRCVCAELPSLSSSDVGRFSAVASLGTELFASMYDGEYGDLVVYRYDSTGKRVGIEYVDGVPTGNAVKYGPSGARGGIVEKGPDVGRYTDVAANDGRVYVSYYDVTNGDLKVAIRNGTTWSSHKVDGTNGDLGLYSSIAIDADGFPGVSYFMRAAEAGFQVSECPTPPTGALNFVTALRFARARVANPTSEADWVVRTVACLSRPPPPCAGCAAPDVCSDVGDGPVCLPAGSADAGVACGALPDGGAALMCDPSTETCVRAMNGLRCGKKYNPSDLRDIPLGVGLFTSLAFNAKTALIAYQQRTGPVTQGRVVPDGDLYAVQVDAQNVRGTPVVISAIGDTGYFPDLKLDGSRQIAIAFHDFSTKSLKYYAAAALTANVPLETIDNGVTASRPGEQSFVGADTSLVFGPQAGQVWVVYQDATRGDLKIARRGTTWTVQEPLVSEGSVGYFADGVYANGRLWATHARLRARMVNANPKIDNSFLLQQGPQN